MAAKPVIVSLHRLRAIAAICVVFAHAFEVPQLHPAKTELAPFFMLFASGTVIFVLLAGIIFSQRAVPKLLEKRSTTSQILRNRLSELMPIYLIAGGFLTAVVTLKGGNGEVEEVGAIYYFLRMMANGSMAHSYWYVPFFLLLMAITPLHLWFLRRRPRMRGALIIGGLLLGSILHRPSTESFFAALHALSYYLPVFWIGLVIGENWRRVAAWAQGGMPAFAILFLSTVAIQLKIGNIHVILDDTPDFERIDLFAIQKVILALLFLGLFERTRQIAMPTIDWIGRNSLSIFFMHPLILIMLGGFPHLSGLYIPEAILVAVIITILGVYLEQSTRRIFSTVRGRLAAS